MRERTIDTALCELKIEIHVYFVCLLEVCKGLSALTRCRPVQFLASQTTVLFMR
jgi:hypothetical protein